MSNRNVHMTFTPVGASADPFPELLAPCIHPPDPLGGPRPGDSRPPSAKDPGHDLHNRLEYLPGQFPTGFHRARGRFHGRNHSMSGRMRPDEN